MVVAFAGAALAGQAAAGWTVVRTTVHGVDYVDRASVTADRHLRRVWTLGDLARPDKDGDRSYRSLLEFDCTSTIYRSLESVFYAQALAGGKPSGRTDVPSPWRQVPDDSAASAVMKMACAKP
jgi:hypothetical protein